MSSRFLAVLSAALLLANCGYTRQIGPRDAQTYPRARIGITGDANYFHDFTNTLGRQPSIASARGDDFALGYGAFAEVRPWARPFAIGVGAKRSVQNFTQFYNSTEPLYPIRADGEVEGVFGGAYILFAPEMLSVLSLVAGAVWTQDNLDLNLQYPPMLQNARTDYTRTHTAYKTRFGVAADIPFYSGLDMRISLDHITSFKGSDADAHTTASFGFSKGFRFTF
jgi:hypothetical protein